RRAAGEGGETMTTRTTALAAALAAVLVPGPLGAAVVVGQAAPDFKVTDSHGSPQSLSGYRGKYVVLEWVNFECPFVGKHYGSGHMQQLQKVYTGKGVVWLSINSSATGKQGYYPAERVNTFVQAKG